MKKFIIITDSCCDLDKAHREEYDIRYIKMNLTYEDKQTEVDLDWENFTAKQFYDMMRNGTRFITSQINIEEYYEEFEKYAKEGYDILSISTSSGLSGSINSSIQAREKILKKYPNIKISCVDTLRGSLAQGLLVYTAAKMREEGIAMDAIVTWIENNRHFCHQIGSVDDLKYLKRAGRVTGAAALICDILKIKPIIISNRKGQNATIAKVKGRKKSINEIIAYAKEHIIDPENQRVFVVHADCYEEAQYIRDILLNDIKCKEVAINYVGPVIGATVGPGMIAIYFYGDEITI